MKTLAFCIILFLAIVTIKSVTYPNQTDVTGMFNSYFNVSSIGFQVVTGYIQSTKAPGNYMFYELVTKEGETLSNKSFQTPIVFWFQGGPGCSSQFGSWGEIGPFYVINQNVNGTTKQIIEVNQKSWNQDAMLVFVDQPYGVGFSVGNASVESTPQASIYFEEFLVGFYQVFKNYNLNSQPTWFWGESFGGHYVPFFASVVLFASRQLNVTSFMGVGIGDGWVNPFYQTQTYDSYYYVTGLGGYADRMNYLRQELQVQSYFYANNYSGATFLFDNMTDNTAPLGNVSVYNIYQYDNDTVSPYVLLLQNATFANQYTGVSNQPKYQECNPAIYNAFTVDISESYEWYINYLLTMCNVVIYNGQLDLIVNSPGVLNWINNIQWNHIQDWQGEQKQIWRLDGTIDPVGWFKNYLTLTYVEVYEAGHMVPADQPAAALDLFRRALNGDWFDGSSYRTSNKKQVVQ